MKKLKTYFWYLVEYLKYGDFLSIIASARYLFNKSSHRRDRVIRTSIGTFFCRKNTNDFQFANFHYEWGVKKYLLDHKKDFLHGAPVWAKGLGRHTHTRSRVGCSRITPTPEGIPAGAMA